MIRTLRNLILEDFWAKLFCLAVAILIWKLVKPAVHNEVPTPTLFADRNFEQQTYFNIPVLVMSSASDVRSFRVNPSEVEVMVQGDTNALRTLQAKDIRALVDLTGIESAPRGMRKRIEVTTPAGITFLRVVPPEVDVIVPPKS
jgi:YbbR-like protein